MKEQHGNIILIRQQTYSKITNYVMVIARHGGEKWTKKVQGVKENVCTNTRTQIITEPRDFAV